MALILKNGAVFLHVPKTGGNWVTTVLRDMGMVCAETPHKHADIDHFASMPKRAGGLAGRLLRETRFHMSGQPFVFSFVRNPLSWYESWFSYMSQPSRAWRLYGDELDVDHWHPNSMLNGLGSPDFNTFVGNVLRKRPGYVSEMYGWYTLPRVAFVGRQESLADDLVRALRMMRLDFDEQALRASDPVGVSPKPHKQIEWDPALRRQVALCEYAGLVRYGYTDVLAELGLPAWTA